MFSPMFTFARKTVAHSCTNRSHLSPTTVILPTPQLFILLKTRRTLIENPSTNQKVGSSSLSGRAIFPRVRPGDIGNRTYRTHRLHF
jgi:hypothetical protein